MTTSTDYALFPELLSAFTVHLRADIGEDGWGSTLARWGDDVDPAKSFHIYTRAACDDEWDTLRVSVKLPTPTNLPRHVR